MLIKGSILDNLIIFYVLNKACQEQEIEHRLQILLLLFRELLIIQEAAC